MTIRYQLEYEDEEKGEWPCIDVFFEGEPTVMNDSFDYAGSHCTHGKSGTYKTKNYLLVEDIIWDESNYTAAENAIIKTFIEDKNNFNKVMGELCDAYQKEYAEY